MKTFSLAKSFQTFKNALLRQRISPSEDVDQDLFEKRSLDPKNFQFGRVRCGRF